MAFILIKYSQENKQLRESEKVILQTEIYLIEFNRFLQKITQLNRELSAIFCKSIKNEKPNLKQFDVKLNEIYIELKNQRIKLRKVLGSLEKFGQDQKWWLVESHKKKYLLNQSLINFYKRELKTFDHQLTNTIKVLKEYLIFQPYFGAQPINNA